jgi:hypothetical protein
LKVLKVIGYRPGIMVSRPQMERYAVTYRAQYRPTVRISSRTSSNLEVFRHFPAVFCVWAPATYIEIRYEISSFQLYQTCISAADKSSLSILRSTLTSCPYLDRAHVDCDLAMAVKCATFRRVRNYRADRTTRHLLNAEPSLVRSSRPERPLYLHGSFNRTSSWCGLSLNSACPHISPRKRG